MSELCCYLAGDAHAPAGTKCISNLLGSKKWGAEVIDKELWKRADAKLAAEQAEGHKALVLWDGSVVEKSETLASEDLCAVCSSRRRANCGSSLVTPGLPPFAPSL